MSLPNLTADDIERTIPHLKVMGPPMPGGQKLVFPCEIQGVKYALKLMLTQPPARFAVEDDESVDALDEITARARREIESMEQCQTPHLVKPGPIPMSSGQIAGQNVIYFCEEWIDGRDLWNILRTTGPLPLPEIVLLAQHVGRALEELWSFAKIHRDIKPRNIMQRESNGEFVLLDLGLALDLGDVSLTQMGAVPGTIVYFSPEQADYRKKRQLDFRSDLFSLGIVLYEATTGRHPFWSQGRSSRDALANILGRDAEAASTYRPEIPDAMGALIMKLLAKRPHLRYRTFRQFQAALESIQRSLG